MIGELMEYEMRRLGPVFRAVLAEVAPADEALAWDMLRRGLVRDEFATMVHFEVVDRCDR